MASASRAPSVQSVDSIKLTAQTKLVPRKYVTTLSRLPCRDVDIFCSDGPTKKGHLMVMVDATENAWERRWFVLRRYVLLY